MLLEHQDRSPRIDGSAYVVPTATVCGDVTIGEASRVMVDGFAVGAGCNLALACDLVVASDRARFGEIFARLGLIPNS